VILAPNIAQSRLHACALRCCRIGRATLETEEFTFLAAHGHDQLHYGVPK
jgi:hypothetical protein